MSSRPDKSRASASARSDPPGRTGRGQSGRSLRAQSRDDGVGVGKTIQTVRQVKEFRRLRRKLLPDFCRVIGRGRFMPSRSSALSPATRFAISRMNPSATSRSRANASWRILDQEIEDRRVSDLLGQFVRASKFAAGIAMESLEPRQDAPPAPLGKHRSARSSAHAARPPPPWRSRAACHGRARATPPIACRGRRRRS